MAATSENSGSTMASSAAAGTAHSLANDVRGVTALVLDGALAPLFLVFSRGLQAAGWPYYRFNGVTFVMIGLGLFLQRAANGTLSRRLIVLKWVMMRGIFGSMAYTFNGIAAPLAPIGDVLALGTINIVVAAVVGQVFLNEKLGICQLLAVLCSLMGASLITRPSFVFGGMGVSGAALVGYLFALASGFANAGNVISSRRLPDAPVSELSASAFLVGGITLMVLPCFPSFTDGDWNPVFASPLIALALMIALVITGLASSFLFTAGSKWLPAAVSATVNNAANLVFGYVSQWVFFGMVPDLLTVAGAVLMFFSVVLVAATKAPKPAQVMRSLSQLSFLSSSPSLELDEDASNQSPEAHEPANPELELDEPAHGISCDDIDIRGVVPSGEKDEDELSLASFIASEYAATPSSKSIIRKRTPAAGTEPTTPTAKVYGMMSAVVPATV